MTHNQMNRKGRARAIAVSASVSGKWTSVMPQAVLAAASVAVALKAVWALHLIGTLAH